MPYNLTKIFAGNDTNILTFTQGVNTELMSGFLGATFLIGFAIVLFTSYMFTTRDFAISYLGTSFICFILSLSLVAMSLLNPIALYITFVTTGLGVFFIWGK